MTRPEDTEYELYVRDIHQTLMNAQGLETIRVEHNVHIHGRCLNNQIDVYWEFKVAGVHHRVIVDCKNYGKVVPVSAVKELAGVLQDIPEARGLIATKVGYSRGAKKYAEEHRIGLKVIRPAMDADWNGRIKTIRTTFEVHEPILTGATYLLDHEWANANNVDPQSIVCSKNPADLVVLDEDSGSIAGLQSLWNQVMREALAVDEQSRVGTIYWKNAVLQQPDQAPIRIKGVEFRWQFKQWEPFTMETQRDARSIVGDALSGRLLFISEDGVVFGDVDY